MFRNGSSSALFFAETEQTRLLTQKRSPGSSKTQKSEQTRGWPPRVVKGQGTPFGGGAFPNNQGSVPKQPLLPVVPPWRRLQQERTQRPREPKTHEDVTAEPREQSQPVDVAPGYASSRDGALQESQSRRLPSAAVMRTSKIVHRCSLRTCPRGRTTLES